jgi:hypothetical protein
MVVGSLLSFAPDQAGGRRDGITSCIGDAMSASGISIFSKFQLDSRNGRRKMAIAVFGRR